MGQSSAFFNDDRFLILESALLEVSSLRIHELKCLQTRRHIKEGFDLRLQMMQSSRIFMRENTKSKEALEAYLWIDFCIHLNSYYLNLRGALDNLAWALNYEFKLLPDSTELPANKRAACNLFGMSFLQKLGPVNEPLAEKLRCKIEWENKLRNLRDPAAHRIPLKPIGGVIIGEGELREFRRLESLAARPLQELGGMPRSHYLREAQLLTQYRPLFAVSSPDKHDHLHIPTQVALDHEIFLSIAEAVFDSLFPALLAKD